MDKREDSSVKETLVHISSRSSKNPYNFFSQEILEHIAADSGFKSIKEFSLGNFNKAYEMMNEALKLDRNHILYYWNLGRLKTLIDGPISSKRYYRDTLELIQKASFEQKELIIKKLRKEMKTPSDKKYHMPISDVIQCILF
jgi:tetratricopeptide (TPR) repeat protein